MGRSVLRKSATIVFVALSLIPGSLPAKYDDTLILNNGDRLSGDIKELDTDLLRLSTDALGDVYVKWDRVQSVETQKNLRIEFKSGQRIVGSIAPAERHGEISVMTARGPRTYPRDNLVGFVPLKLQSGWLSRLEGGVRFGLNGSKGSNTIQWNVGSNLTYRGLKYDVTSRLDTIVSNKSDETDSQRIGFFNSYRRLLRERWYWGLLAGYEKNDELGVDDRYSAGGGFGRFLLRSSVLELAVNGGLLAAREFTKDAVTNQLESFVAAEFGLFQHSFPKTQIRAYGAAFPSLTDSGRVRTNIDVSISRELIRDFAVALSVYYSTDNKPPNEASRDDWGIATSLEYKL